MYKFKIIFNNDDLIICILILNAVVHTFLNYDNIALKIYLINVLKNQPKPRRGISLNG